MKKFLPILVLLLAGGVQVCAQTTVLPGFGGGVTIDASVSRAFKVPVSAAISSVAINNASPGEQLSIVFQQNAVGGFAVVFGGNVATCTVSVVANASTDCEWRYDATSNFWNLTGAGIGSGLPSGGLIGQLPVNTAPGVGAWGSSGLADGNGGAPVTITPYAIKCDNGTQVRDRTTVIRFQSGASVINAPDHTASGCASNMTFILIDDGAGALTVNRGGSDTFTIVNGSTNVDGATSFTMTNGMYVKLNNGAGGIWEAQESGISGGANLTYDLSTGQPTLTVGNTATPTPGVLQLVSPSGILQYIESLATVTPLNAQLQLPPDGGVLVRNNGSSIDQDCAKWVGTAAFDLLDAGAPCVTSAAPLTSGNAVTGAGSHAVQDAGAPPALAITANVTVYAAPAGLTTCSYNGATGVACTPSTTAATCGTQAIPCQEFSTVAAKFNNFAIIPPAVVTVQLSDTAGNALPSGKCYQPNGVTFQNIFPNTGAPEVIVYAADVPMNGADTYPASYLYFLGNPSTPANINITGATTCGGTTSSNKQAVVMFGGQWRMNGMSVNYFTANAVEVRGAGGVLYAENITGNGDNAGGGQDYLVGAIAGGVARLGGTWNNTNDGVCDTGSVNSQCDFESLNGQFTLTYSNSTAGENAFLVNESGYMNLQCVTMTFNGSGAYHAFQAQNSGKIQGNQPPSCTSTVTFNAANATAYNVVANSFIADFCGNTRFICNFTALGQLANSQQGSYFTCALNANCQAGTNPSTISSGGSIRGPGTGIEIHGMGVLLSLGTQTVSGCSLTTALGGASAGSFHSGTAGTCTVTITPGITALNGFVCQAWDITTAADTVKQTAFTTTTCTISGTTASGDVITWMATAF